MAEWVPIENSISLDALLKRWDGIEAYGEELDFKAIDLFIRGGQITAYDKKDWVILNGHKQWCGEKRSPILGLNGTSPDWPSNDIIFDMEEISRFEKQILPNNTGKSEDESEYIPAEDIRKELGLSPTEFVKCLRKHHTSLPLYGFTRNDMDCFYDNFTRLVEAADMLHNITVHRMDWENFQRWGIPFPSVAVSTAEIDSQLAEVKRQLVEKDSRIAALGSELAAARQQIAELTAELNSAKVEPATTVNAAMWKDSVSAAFGVWAEIVQGDKTDWKEEEFRAALVTRCADYLTDVHAIAWRILPGTFKHGRGRPKKNPGNIQQSDNT